MSTIARVEALVVSQKLRNGVLPAARAAGSFVGRDPTGGIPGGPRQRIFGDQRRNGTRPGAAGSDFDGGRRAGFQVVAP